MLAGLARYSPVSHAGAEVRRFVTAELRQHGREALADVVTLAVSELVANVVIHARTEFEVRVLVLSDRVRVEVQDGSATMPLPGNLSATAMSGRGLLLLASMTDRWGADPLPGSGKVVWFEVGGTVSPDEDGALTAEALIDAWAELEPVEDDTLVRVQVPSLPVAALVAAKTQMEDVIRDLQLVLLNHGSQVTDRPVAPEEVRLARRLDAAAEEFCGGRLQIRAQALRAADAGETSVALDLALHLSQLEAVRRYRDALEDAYDAGGILAEADLVRHRELRRTYLDEIIRQLEGSDPAS